MFRYLKHLFSKAAPDKHFDSKRIYKLLRYRFKDPTLLITALTHRSYLVVTGDEAISSNERLEFLGDAVLDLIVTDFLYKKHPQKLEGDLSKIKSILVSRRALAQAIRQSQIGQYMLMNYGEEKTGGKKRTSNLSNLYESLVAAIYLDGGITAARKYISWTLLQAHESFLHDSKHINYKSILLEYAQKEGFGEPRYDIIRAEGPDHEKTFVIEVSVNGNDKAAGAGRSKKGAEQLAARKLINRIAPELLDEEID
jgi:ribonuclease-3